MTDAPIDMQQIFSGGGTDYTPLFRALLVQRHNRALTDDEFLQLLKAHVGDGFALIKNDTAGFKSSIKINTSFHQNS